MVGKLPELAELLDADRAEGPDLSAPQDTPYGVLSPPLAPARLKALEVLYSILGLSDPAAEQGTPLLTMLFLQLCCISNLVSHCTGQVAGQPLLDRILLCTAHFQEQAQA